MLVSLAANGAPMKLRPAWRLQAAIAGKGFAKRSPDRPGRRIHPSLSPQLG
jgi:hypothetical protein